MDIERTVLARRSVMSRVQRGRAKYVRWGLRKHSNEEARARFVDKTRPKLAAMGLTPPPDETNRRFL